MPAPWVIALPAWGEWYVDLCVRYAIPSIRAALAEGGVKREARFVVHTDQPGRMREALQELGEVDCRPVLAAGFEGFVASHRDAIAATAPGSNLLLHNADVIVSRETFEFAEDAFDCGFKALASVAHRCAPGNDPPIGVDATTLAAWTQRNRHPIAIDCEWGSGSTGLPTVLFFANGENVVMHGFHLGPTVVRKDEGDWSFTRSVDYNLLERFAKSEIYVVADLEYASAEVSPLSKRFATGRAFDVDAVAKFGATRFTPLHLWLARHRLAVAGDCHAVDNAPAYQIIAEIERRQACGRS